MTDANEPRRASSRTAQWAARGVVALVALCAFAVASKVRGARSTTAEPAAPFSAASPAAASAAPAAASPSRISGDPHVLGVALRLIDLLGEAVYDAADVGRADAALAGYWRRMRAPYTGPGGRLDRVVQQVALVREGGQAHEASFVGTAVKGWNPDPKIWNMTDGSFEHRESILLPAPGSVRYRVRLPEGAVFETAPSLLMTSADVDFEVAVTPQGGARSVVATRTLHGATRIWEDWRVPLGAYGGKNVELELSTRARAPAGAVVPAFWGTPVVLAPGASSVPFNVVFIVVDALRGDAIAATHDDAADQRMASAEHPPLDAWLPRMPDVAPNLNALAAGGAIFARAWSAATWTRPGTVAMLTGTRSGLLGLSPLDMIPRVEDVRRFYANRPPFLPLVLRPYGVETRAVVNNFYMTGYAGVGVDMGFEGVVDHRSQLQDTAKITADTLSWLDANRDRRFALFVNFASPHSPYEPPAADLAAVPKPPAGPADATLRLYLGEIHKDDAAIGQLMAKLDALGIADDTLVVVTGDHGETLSAEHDGVPFDIWKGDPPPGRFHHLLTMWDEAVRVPIVMRYPRKIAKGLHLTEPVQTTDITPTILDLAGLGVPAAMRGRSLAPLFTGGKVEPRPVVVEGRAARAIRDGHYRLIVRDRAAQRVRTIHGERRIVTELYDLETDPGERVDLSATEHDKVTELTARLSEWTKPLAAPAGRDTPAEHEPTIVLRFAGGGAVHRITGRITAPAASGESAPKLTLEAVPHGSVRTAPIADGYTLELTTEAQALVGLDVHVSPATTPLHWSFLLDGQPLPPERFHAGSFGLRATPLADGLLDEGGRLLASAEIVPIIDPAHELGVFVTRDAGAHEIDIGTGGAGEETMRLMKSWGYARDDSAGDKP